MVDVCARLNVGDKAMLVGVQGFGSRLWVRQVTVEKVYKNGQIVLDGMDQRYRPDGYPTGKRTGYITPARLKPWDDALWQQANIEASQAVLALRVHDLGDALKMLARDHSAAADVWESLPFSVRNLINPKEGEV